MKSRTRIALSVLLMMSTACGQDTVQVRPGSDAWTHYQHQGRPFSFDHPPEWKERSQQFLSGSFTSPIGIFSTRRPDQSLCYRRSTASGGIEQGCDLQRLGKLAPGDVVLMVSIFGMPDRNGLPPGEPLVVDGHDASLSRTVRACGTAIGADNEVTLTISLPPSYDFLILEACALKVPGLDQTMRRVAASTRLEPLPS
jgi:hypothetical protein